MTDAAHNQHSDTAARGLGIAPRQSRRHDEGGDGAQPGDDSARWGLPRGGEEVGEALGTGANANPRGGDANPAYAPPAATPS